MRYPWTVTACALSLVIVGPVPVSAAATARPDPKRQLIQLRITYTGSGSYTRTDSDGCSGGPKMTDVSFSWRNEYQRVGFVPASLAPTSTNVNLIDGVRTVSGGWSRTCGYSTSGTIADASDAGGTSDLATTVRARLDGTDIELQIEALYQLGDPDRDKLFYLGKSGGCCTLGPAGGPSDSVTSALVTIVRVPLASLTKLEFGKPGKLSIPVAGPTAPWSFLNCQGFNPKCTDSVMWRGMVDIEPGCPNSRFGPGYDGLAPKMKSALNQLYFELERQNACYRFTSGYRSRAEQDKVRKRWHDIADDGGPKDRRSRDQVCTALKSAGFAQCPAGSGGKWRGGTGVASGGPAKESRHTSKTAADITVLWPPGYQRNLGRFQDAARKAGLCGPPSTDPVHVELPYAKPAAKNKAQRGIRCWFPPGPAP